MTEILAIGAHPDDCEIFMGGTLLYLKSIGKEIAVCDMTKGEMGTYGNEAIRAEELNRAKDMIGLKHRYNLNIPDGNVSNTHENRLKVIEIIRKLRPEIVFSHSDKLIRHPDHKNCGQLVKESCFLAGIEKIRTVSPPFRPSALIEFPELIIKDKPDFIIDITDFWEKKVELIRCYGTQVTKDGEDDNNTKTLLRSNGFWDILKARSIQAGAMIGVTYGEPFYTKNPPKIQDPIRAFKRGLK